MGTNYYAVKSKPTTREPIHIGKSSLGWMFLFQAQNEVWDDPPVAWHSFDELKTWLKKYVVEEGSYVILDEYDEVISYDDFISMVEEKQKADRNNPENFEFCENVNGYRFMDQEFC